MPGTTQKAGESGTNLRRACVNDVSLHLCLNIAVGHFEIILLFIDMQQSLHFCSFFCLKDFGNIVVWMIKIQSRKKKMQTLTAVKVNDKEVFTSNGQSNGLWVIFDKDYQQMYCFLCRKYPGIADKDSTLFKGTKNLQVDLYLII